MDYKFLNKVVDQIVSETRVDYDRKVIKTPFRSFTLSSQSFLPPYLPLLPSSSSSLLSTLSLFSNHCEDIYGLNEQEIDYVWEEYKRIIKDKINSNG
tara:strand:+ start:933 stop:1223 length:291 start_codon:yes stop_codon:yes gene_type:complete